MHVQSIRTRLRLLFSVATFAALSITAFSQSTQPLKSGTTKPSINAMEMPLTFEANQGQTDGQVRFFSRGAGYALFLTNEEAVLSVAKSHRDTNGKLLFDHPGTIRLKLEGANPRVAITPESAFAGKSNYYIGNDPSKWRTGVPMYARVRYRSIYPGVDMVYYGNQRRLEHDFIVAPGASPKQIRIAVDGAQPKLDSNGDLLLNLDGGPVRLLKPVLYQDVKGSRREIAGSYKLLANNQVGFEVGKYDKSRELVIDPILVYSTYYGGTNVDQAYAVAIGGGIPYVAGSTLSFDFPTKGNIQRTYGQNGDAFVVQLNPAFSGSGGVGFATYLGGSGTDEARGIAFDNTNLKLWVAGYTNSSNFPTAAGGLPTQYHGGNGDGFVVEINPSLGALVHSGFLGGSGEDHILGLAYDPVSGHLLLTGASTSYDFPYNPVGQSNKQPLSSQLYRTADGASSWNASGGSLPDAIEGMDVQAFLVLPNSVAFYAGGSSGVWRSTDGQLWIPVNDTLPSQTVTCLVANPSDPTIIYACTSNGVWQYDQTGDQWTNIGTGIPAGTKVNALLFNPSSATTMYAATDSGVYVSVDTGATFSTLNSGLPTSVTARSLAAGPGNNIYLGIAGDGVSPAIWQLSGSTWVNSSDSNLPAGSGVYGDSLVWDSRSNTIYVGIENYGLFYSTDGGVSWTQGGTDYSTTPFASNINKIALDPTDQTVIYLATENGIWRSTDSGASFFRSDLGIITGSVRALAVDRNNSLSNGQTILYSGSYTQQGFVVSLNASDYSYVLATMFGGDGPVFGSNVSGIRGAIGYGIASDPSGSFYVAGATPSGQGSIPGITGGAQQSNAGEVDAVLMKFDSTGSVSWGTFLGGSGYDQALGVAADSNSVYVGGSTFSSDFPVTAGVFQNSCANSCAFGDAFVAKYNNSGAKLWATFIGGSNFDQVNSIGLNSAGQPVLGGVSIGATFPQANPLGAYPGPAQNGFVSVLDTNGAGLIFSSLLGGSTSPSLPANSVVTSLALSGGVNIFAVGYTSTTDFPIITGAAQPTLSGSYDAFVSEISTTSNSRDISISMNPTTVNTSSGSPVTFNITVTNNSSTGAASNVQLVTNLALTSFTSPNGTCTTAPAVCSFGSVPANSSVTATATYSYPQAGSFVDIFTARTDDDDPNTANNQQTVSATITPGSADIGISISGPQRVGTSTSFTYNVNVTNNGPSAAANFQYSVVLDSQLSLDVVPGGCTFNPDNRTVTCDVTSLGANQTQTTTVPVTSPGVTGSVASNASVTVAGDPNSSNNNSSATTTVVNTSDLYLIGSTFGNVVLGAPVTIDLSYGNNGPSPATGAVVTFSLPSSVTFNSANGLSCTGTVIVTCNIGNLPIDTNPTPTAQLIVTPNQAGAFTITGSIQSNEYDPTPSDASMVVGLTAGPNAGAYEQYVVSESDSGSVTAYQAGSSNSSSSSNTKAGSSPAISVIDPSGRYIFVTAGGFSAYTSVVDLTIHQEIARIRGAVGRPMVFTPDGSKLITRYAAVAPGTQVDRIAFIDPSTFQITKTINLDGVLGDQVGVNDIGIQSGIVANNKLYLQVSSVVGGVAKYPVISINLANDAVTVINVPGGSPSGQQRSVARNSSQTRVYVLHRNTTSGQPASLYAINTSNDTVAETLSLGNIINPFSIAATQDPNDPNGQYAYISGNASNGGTIRVVNLSNTTLLSSQNSVSFPPHILLLSSDGTYVHVFQSGMRTGAYNAAYQSTDSLRNLSEGLQQYQVNNYVGGVSMGLIGGNIGQPPVVGGFYPAAITDTSSPTTISIYGSGFAPDSKVKFGNLDPLGSPAVTFVSSGRLDFTVPAGVPEQDAEVVVTLPNTQELPTGRNVSGTSYTSFNVKTSFQLNDPLLVLRYGDSHLDFVQKDKNGSGVNTFSLPVSFDVSPDGNIAYFSNQSLQNIQGTLTGYIQAVSLTTGNTVAQIPVLGDNPGYQDGFTISTDPVDGKPVLYYVAIDNPTANPSSDQLFIVDLDPNSATYHQVKRTIRSPQNDYIGSSVWTVRATPDGRYVYATYDAASDGKTRLEQFDVLNGTVTGHSDLQTLFGAEDVPNHMRVTPDGNWVLLPATDGSIKAVNVANRDLTSPQVITISDSGRQFKNFQVVGSRLFAFDSINNVLAAFNFLPAQSNFSKLGQVTLSTLSGPYVSAMTVDPTGAYVYLSVSDQDTIVVLDANKVAASDSSAILARGNGGVGVWDIKIASAVPTQQVDLSVNGAPSTVVQGAQASISYFVSNVSNVTATNVVATTSVPSGVTITSAVYYSQNTSGLCTVSLPTISCSISGLDPGQNLNVSIRTDAVASTGVYDFQTTVSSNEADANPADNSATQSLTVSPGADISVSGQAPTSLQPGQSVNITFTVNNAGPSTQGPFHVLFTSSPPLDNQTITPPAGGGITCPSDCVIPSLAPNTPLVFTVSGNVADTRTQSFTGDVEYQYIYQTDPNLTNNSITLTPQIISAGATTNSLLITDAALANVFSIDAGTGTQDFSFNAGVTARQALVMPNAKTAFIINQDANYISVVDLGIQKEINRIRGVVPAGATLNSDGSHLIVSDRITNDLVVIDSTSFSTLGRTAAPDVAASLLAVGSKVFVMYRNAPAAIGVLDLNSGTLSSVAGTSTFSTFPGHLGVTPDGLTVIAVGGGTTPAPATFYRIDATTNTVVQSLVLPTNTRNLSLAVTPVAAAANQYAYVTMDNTLVTIDVKPGSPTLGQILPGSRDIGISAQSSGISPDGAAVVFVQSGTRLNHNYTVFGVAQQTVSINSFSGSLQSATGAVIDPLPSSTAPLIGSIAPNGVLNDTAQSIEIDGQNFSSDAVVRIGSSDWITPDSVTPTKITFTLPAFTPSGTLDVVVVNRNSGQSLTSRNEAGVLSSGLNVADGPNYLGLWNTFIANFGDGTYTTTQFTDANTQRAGIGQPWGITATKQDNFFITSQADKSVQSSINSEGLSEIPLAGNVGYGDAIAAVPDPQTGRDIVVAPSSVPNGTNTDWQLNVIDADIFSPTVNLVIRTIRANSSGATTNPNGFAATPDGKYAFGFFNANDTTGRLAVYNLANNSSTILVNTTLGIDNFVQDAQVSPDGKYLAVSNSLTTTVKIFDITNPVSPVLRGTITPTVPNGTYPSCCNIRFASNRIFIFDPGTMQLQVFNFLPTTPDFSSIGSITVPGSPDPVWQGGFGVSPDGAYIYVAQYGDDSMAVFDGAKVAASAPDALITRIQTGRAPVSVALNPVATFSYTADLSVLVTHSPEPVVQGSDVTFTATVTNNGPFSTNDGLVAFSDDLPTGMRLKSISASSANASCSGTGAASAQCNLGPMDPGATITVTFVADTTNAHGTLQNVARVAVVRSTVPDPNPANNQSAETITIGEPDLAVAITAGAPVAGVNGTLDYTVTITNNGTVPATNVTASINHSNFFVSVQEPQCGVDGNAFCSFASIGAGQSQTIHLVAQMPGTAGSVTAGASVSESETDANPSDNTTTLQTTVVNPDLAISITANPPSPVINGLVTYTATITNNSTVATATNAFSILSLDAGQIKSSPECSLDGNAYCTIGTVAPGASVVVHVTAQMPGSAGTVTMSGNVTLNETDANPADNSTTLAVTVGGGADLVLTAADKPVIIGGVPTYTVTVTNNGPDPAPNVVVTDELTRFQFVSAVSSVGACSYNGILVSCPIGALANGGSATVSVSVVPPSSGWALSEFHATSDTIDPNGNNNVANLGPTGGTVGNTKAGFNVLVDALDSVSGMPASFTFANVTRPGLTTVQSSMPSQPPAGFRFGSPARVFDLSTTAAYTGSIQVTLQFAGTTFHHPDKVRLFHFENGAWVDRTAGIDAVHGLITGVTTSLSPFMLVEPLNTAPVASAPDSTVPAATSNGAQLTLSAAASTDADGDSLTYHWTGPFPEGNGSVTGVSPSVTLPVGASKITLVVNDGETDSAPVTVNAVVSDFLVAIQSSQITLRRGQTTSFDIAVSPKFGTFSAAVALACSNLPSGVTCSISNGSVTPGIQGATATVTLTASPNAGMRPTSAPVFALWLGGLPVFGFLLTGSLRPKNWRGWLLLGIVLLMIAGMIACGGGGKSSSSNATSNTTSSSTTSITVTGTAAGVQHSSTATLTLQ